MGGLGLDKMLIGVDIVGDGSTTVQIAYNQQDKSSFSDNPYFVSSTNVTPYFVAIDDTVPGTHYRFRSLRQVIHLDTHIRRAGTVTTPECLVWEGPNFYLETPNPRA